MFSISQFLPCSISKRMKMNHSLRTRFLSPLDLFIWGLRELSWSWRTIRAKKSNQKTPRFLLFFPYPTMYLVFDHNQKHVASKARFFIRSNLISKIMRVSAAIPRGRSPGNPRATHGLSRGFVAKACPARGALERFCVFGKIPRGHTHGICT